MSRYTDREIEMSCDELRASIDDLLSKTLSELDLLRLYNHAACCGDCGERLDRARQVHRLVVHSAPDVARSEDFEERMMQALDSADRRPVRTWPRGVAVAALVLMALLLWPMTYWNQVDAPDQAAVSLTEWEPPVREVRLAFASEKALENVRLTLDLPDNVELAPFPGRQSLSWHVDLSVGDNVLTLPLRVLYPAEAELVATLDDGKRHKTFRTPIPGELVKSEFNE